MSTRVFIVALVAVLGAHLAAVRIDPGFGRVVDLFLVLTVLNALDGNKLTGMLGGLVCGLIHDAFSGQPYGLHGFADTLAGYLTAVIVLRLVTQHPIGLAGVFAVVAVIQQASLILLAALAIPSPDLPELPWVGVRIVTAAVLGLLLYLFGRRFKSRFDRVLKSRRTRLRLD